MRINVYICYLSWIIDPHERLVAGDHGHEVGERAQGVVGGARCVHSLFRTIIQIIQVSNQQQEYIYKIFRAK